MVRTECDDSCAFGEGPFANLVNQSRSERVAVLSENQEAVVLDFRVKGLEVNWDELGAKFVENIATVYYFCFLDLSGQLGQ